MGLKMSTKIPLVIIFGSTGSGKTKLSLEIANKFGGEIIGADSMQLYKELDIASAKATKDELSMAPHHMINILEPSEMCTVLNYRNKTLPIIDSILDKNNIPIIVGGTNYYIEALLWKILVENPEDKVVHECGSLPNNEHELPSHVLHDKLKVLDPAMARRLHPNNKRKILRSLEVLHQKGKRYSEILEENQKGGSSSGGGLRYDNVLALWLQCDQDILDKRLDDRVQKMIEQGLLEELLHFHKQYNQERLKVNREPDYTRGIFQSIGFKEFHSYLVLSEDERKSKEAMKIYEECLEKLKIATRRYARKQTKWVVNRFLGRKDRQVPPIYGLDTSDVTKWNENVSIPAFKIVQSYISKSSCDFQPLPVRDDIKSVPNSLDDTYVCEVCERIFIGEFQWNNHIKSRKHKKIVQKVKKEKEKSEVSSNMEGE